MSAPIDCPICMDSIESTTRNCVTTECGHCFHANCLMQNVAHNGFGCPYCRAAMIEEPEEEESIWSDEDEEEDEEEEDDLNQSTTIPSTDYVAQKLREQGVTYEQLVKNICYMEYREYGNEDTERANEQIYENICSIMDNYTSEPSAVVAKSFAHLSLEQVAEEKPPKVSFVRRLECC